jgi:peptide/nickel transport system ATP-binding protein
MTEPKVQIENLKKHFSSDIDLMSRLLGTGEPEMVKAVDGVSLEIQPGEAFGIAGESGCGKTTLGKTILKLYEPTEGSIYFDGVDITETTDIGGQHFRTAAQMIQQDPYKSLNPRFRVFNWLKEPLDIHNIGTVEERTNRVMETLENVGLSPAEAYAYEYPSELSGGERQRVGIGRAIILNPSFVVADEPVSMLDVSVRASVLSLLNELQEEMGLATLYISHDLSLLKHMCDRLAIMYLGKIVEIGPAEDVIDNPQHPYTRALVSSTPVINPDKKRKRINIEGEIPDPINLPPGCRFAPRCPKRIEECTEAEPRMYNIGNQNARCILHDDEIDAEYEDDAIVVTDTTD